MTDELEALLRAHAFVDTSSDLETDYCECGAEVPDHDAHLAEVLRAEWEPRVRAAALREAAEEIHVERRWQTEMVQRKQQGGALLERLRVIENILKDRAAEVERT